MGGAVEEDSAASELLLLPSLTKHVQEMSLDGDQPPQSYLVDRGNGVPDPAPPLAQIPTIDLSLLSSSTSKEGAEELQKLKSALTTWGCFQAIGHGISTLFLDKIREMTKQFFALPMEEKLKYARPADSIEGYGNDPILSDKQVLDWLDRLMLTVAPAHSRTLHLWPKNPTQFCHVLDEYAVNMLMISKLLLKAMSRSVELEEDCFLNQYGDGGEEIMAARFNYYPVCPRPDLVLGAKSHSDGSAITILLQDQEVEGLQIFKDDQWYRAPIVPYALLVNAGDQLQIMSNGIFKSPLHRVTASSEKERMSIAVFHLPNAEVEIEPAAGLVDEKRPQQYRKLKNYAAINFESFQSGKIALDTVKL